MFTDNKDFYPTPNTLIGKMWFKLPKEARWNAHYILEPSAGAGHIVDFIKEENKYRPPTIHAIEKDEKLAAMLRGKNIEVIDNDFLTFSGPDKYDVIIGNPPFSAGEHHLLKALEIMYSGHIVFLLNAETLKNPCTAARKSLLRKLAINGASIEYLTESFASAERRTKVEVALVYIHIERKIEDDLFSGVTDAKSNPAPGLAGPTELVGKDSIVNLVADYNRTIEIGTRTLLDFYKNHHHISQYLDVTIVGQENKLYHAGETVSLTEILQIALNDFVKAVRKSYWAQVLTLDKVAKRMTEKKRAEFRICLQKNQSMDFTESNIRTFILNLIGGYDQILTDAVMEVFEKMTVKHAWAEDLHIKNVHYFDGWRTNNAYRANKKVIIPFWGNPFFGFGGWRVDYAVKDALNDIDIVMNYFDGRAEYVSIINALETGFKEGQTSGIKSTYFIITVHKKGTIHLTFNDEDVLRRFNITACKEKNWLPENYGQKKYEDLTAEEKGLVNTFEESAKVYSQNVTDQLRLFKTKSTLQIEYEKEAA